MGVEAAQSVPHWAYLLGPLVTLLAASIAASFAWVSLRTNSAVNVRNKRMDVIMHCNLRYDALYEVRRIIETNYKERPTRGTTEREKFDHDVKVYVRRYWGLKSDQLDYWLAGYVDPETISSWLMSTVDLLSKSESVIDLRDYLDELETHKTVNERLVEVVFFLTRISQIKNGKNAADQRNECYALIFHYLRILEREESSLIYRLSENRFSRFKLPEFSRMANDKIADHYDYYSVQHQFVDIWNHNNKKKRSLVTKIISVITGENLDTKDRINKFISDRHPYIKYITPSNNP